MCQMKKKRILSAIVAFATALCGVTFFGGRGMMPDMSLVAGAEETSSGGISVSQAKVQKGGSFSVDIDVPANNIYIDTIEIRLLFDTDAFEITAWNPGISGAETNYSNSGGFATIVYATGGSGISLKNGFKFSAVMRAKSDAKLGEYDFKLSRCIVNSYDYNYRWNSPTTSATVKIINNVTTVGGTITSNGVPGTAVVTLTDGSGNASEAEVVLTESARVIRNDVEVILYSGKYSFSGVEIGDTVTIKAELDGCIANSEKLVVSSTAYTGTQSGNAVDLSMNKRADVDGDGTVSAFDATQILRYLTGKQSVVGDAENTAYIILVACVTGGDRVTVADATQILRFLAGKSSVFGNVQG